jgi:pimeloyl-ACP methyl ester carboxylesterase
MTSMPTTLTVEHGDVRFECESWGANELPTVLLIAGTSCTRDWWPPVFCERLAATGVHVIRFDQRDTGASSTFPVGDPGYGLTDMVEDALAVIDAFDVERAHLVGFSQGGWVAQLLALHHPARVASLALLSTRPTEHGAADPDLPEVSTRLMESWATLPEPDWSNREDVITSYVEGERVLAGTSFDEEAVRDICATAIARSTNPQSASNHPLMRPSPRWRETLGQVHAPTTVIHGTADPLFPIGNGEALAAEIPGAALRIMDGVGHEFPSRIWDEVIDAIGRHIGLDTRAQDP